MQSMKTSLPRLNVILNMYKHQQQVQTKFFMKNRSIIARVCEDPLIKLEIAVLGNY